MQVTIFLISKIAYTIISFISLILLIMNIDRTLTFHKLRVCRNMFITAFLCALIALVTISNFSLKQNLIFPLLAVPIWLIFAINYDSKMYNYKNTTRE